MIIRRGGGHSSTPLYILRVLTQCLPHNYTYIIVYDMPMTI